ncbi:PPOX class F420-dependent oxidoreductase [Microbispora sp. NBC_01389]|uniref:PPOX class F420-dependent oxidoreductase n=1 Tax=Microbispora sp. NBC_01389 TaxID=2903584 RepID=UPI003251D31F
MDQMTEAEWRAFAMAETRTGTLAITRMDGRPHATPVWFALDGGDVVFTTHESSVKARELRRDSRATLCVDDQRPPYSFVMMEGEAALSGDLDEVRRWAAEIGGRYLGEEHAEECGERAGVPGALLVRLSVRKVVAYKEMAA